MLSTALVSARADFFPPSLANLRGGASNDLVDSLTSLKELLNKLETRVKTPPPTVEPLVVDPQVGDLVRVRPDVEQPKFDWGEATHTSVGRLTWYFEDRCTVDFPKHPGWNGLLSELERVSADEEEEEEEEAGDEAPALALAVGMQVRLRPGAAPPDGGWGAAGPPAEDSANLTSWVGEVEALGADGEEVTVVLEHGARWTGVASSLDVLEDPDAPRDRSDVDPTARLRRLGERSRRRGSAAGGTPRAPLFSALGSSFSASSAPAPSGADVRRARLTVPPARLPGVPAPTWLGWTLGAAFAQVATRPGGVSTLGGRRRRRAGSGAAMPGGVPDASAVAPSDAAGETSDGRPHDHSEGMSRPRPKPLVAIMLTLVRLLSPLFSFLTLVGLLLSALSMVLDQVCISHLLPPSPTFSHLPPPSPTFSHLLPPSPPPSPPPYPPPSPTFFPPPCLTLPHK